MNIRIVRLVLAALLCGTSLSAQFLDHIQGEILVKPAKDQDPRFWTRDFQYLDGLRTDLHLQEKVSDPMGVWSYVFDFTTIDENRLLALIRRHPAVEIAQFNHLLAYRNDPDDPGFSQQWQYLNTGQSGGQAGADIDMELAWDITTGGLTADGDTIVVCVIDDGLDPNHEDFEGNIWVNHQEIPNNGIDDDGNGYIDDYRGWNTVDDDDNIYIDGGHGTPVAGIVGARGNNGAGVAGVNWDVKIMVVYNAGLAESQVLEAYSFPLTHRMRYNETNGEEGAFVVSTNASWGINFGQPADSPLWCAFYDTLGVHGILSCGATINSNVNVDEAGDLPTACSSDYLISVTNMNHFDNKVGGAGYGATTIDLGAFGQGTWTTAAGNSYGGFGGTSGATPHVTGTIGLLYSAPCSSLMALAKADPGAAALLVKQYILEGVDPNESLDTITVTGGRLNVNNSLQLLMNNCGPCPPPAALRAVDVIDTTATLTWLLTDSVLMADLRWRPVDDTVWTEIPEAVSPYALDGLTACTEYEFQLRGYCASDTLDYNQGSRFRTDGCCELPGGFSVAEVEEEAAFVAWEGLLAAQGYFVRIREVDSLTWDTIAVEEASLVLTGLTGCTNYELQIRPDCADETLDFGNSRFFRTRGCGLCLDGDYCEPDGLNTADEWIDSISLHTLQWASGSDGGYGNFTDLPELSLEAGASYELTLAPGYSGFNWSEEFAIWIDSNQDGNFTSEEVAFESPGAAVGTITGTLTVPFDALEGGTRMRVVMQYENITGNCNFPPGSYGEVEDYCVNITPLTTCPTPANLDTLLVAQTLVRLEWEPSGGAEEYKVEYRPDTDTTWQSLVVSGTNLFLTNLTNCTLYEARVQALCSFGDSETYAGPLFFRTVCTVSSVRDLPGDVHFDLAPNPFREQLNLALDLPARYREARIDLLSPVGQRLKTITPGNGIQQVSIDGTDLPPGLYLLRLRLDGEVEVVRKVVRVR